MPCRSGPGVIPLKTVAGAPEPDPRNLPGVEMPPHVREFRWPDGGPVTSRCGTLPRPGARGHFVAASGTGIGARPAGLRTPTKTRYPIADQQGQGARAIR